MTLRLILTRHAKSDWNDPEMEDHDRPLNPRGSRSAPAIGTWIEARGYAPDAVLVSTATRAVETWEGVASALSKPPEARLDAALYLAEPEEMFEVLREAEGHTVLLIGHNPGIAELARGLAESPPADPDFDRYPTCATTVIYFDAEDWRDVAPGTGRAEDFITPRDLL